MFSNLLKIIAKSPLKQSFVRAISCLVPSTIAGSRTVAQNRMKLLAQILYERGHTTAVIAYKSRSQFSDLCARASGTLESKFSAISRSKSRLDTLFYDVIGEDPDYADLVSLVRLVLILSHRNATAEGGFSVNGDMLVENLQEESLVGQRIVLQ